MEDSQTELSGNTEGEGVDQASHAGQTEFVPPKDGSWVPRERFDHVARRVAALEAQAAVKPEAPLPTTAEIRQQLDNGDIDDAQADEMRESRIVREITDQVAVSSASQSREQRLQAELRRYEQEVPEFQNTGSVTFNRVSETYRRMVQDDGLPNSSGTQVAAVRQVLGPLSAIPQRKTDSFDDSVGGGQQPVGDKTLYDGLTKDRKDWYQTGIKAGRYKDQAAVEDELKYYTGRGNTL